MIENILFESKNIVFNNYFLYPSIRNGIERIEHVEVITAIRSFPIPNSSKKVIVLLAIRNMNPMKTNKAFFLTSPEVFKDILKYINESKSTKINNKIFIAIEAINVIDSNEVLLISNERIYLKMKNGVEIKRRIIV